MISVLTDLILCLEPEQLNSKTQEGAEHQNMAFLHITFTLKEVHESILWV